MTRRLDVLWLSQRPGPTTNPYITQLVASLDAQADITFFSWRVALTQRFDAVHVHWPEIKLQGTTPLKRLGSRCLFALLLLRLTLTRTPVVRTVHNLNPHDGVARVDRSLLRWLERRTTVWIRLSELTPKQSHGQTVTIPHGHYVDWFTPYPRDSQVPGRLVYVGLIRPYKGVDDLMNAFAAVADESLSLHVCGSVQDAALERQIQELAEADPRVSLDLRYISDDRLVSEVTQAQLVVLPYRDLHNSGALLLALSLGRPVLVPSTPTTEAIALEVGSEWVITYSGDLTEAVIKDAVSTRTSSGTDGVPDLSARDWGTSGTLHLAAYETAVRTSGRRYSE